MASSRDMPDILKAFETSWQRGERPVIETFLVALVERPYERTELLIELVHTELELRLKAGETARVEQYLERFPELAESQDALRDFLIAEFEFRRRREGKVSPDEYQQRFPQLADELVAALQTSAERRFPVIAGYELRDLLGQGGMGQVYKAWQPKLRRWVAIKVLTSSGNFEPRALARFEREMAALGQINHPNLVRAVDAAEFNGLHYLVMEYVSGHDAAWLSRRLGPWPIAEACELIRQAALGMQAAYETGLVHRDLKPSNVMVSDTGEVKVLDLGLALWQFTDDQERTSLLGDLTGTGVVMGTVDYMAPEQADNSHTVDIRADLYSLGASLFKLLIGKAPFADAGSHAKRFAAVINAPPPNIQSLRADIPDPLAVIILRLLQKNPADRYATPAELAAALAEFCAGADLRAVVADRVPPVATMPSRLVSQGALPIVNGHAGTTLSLHELSIAKAGNQSERPIRFLRSIKRVAVPAVVALAVVAFTIPFMQRIEPEHRGASPSDLELASDKSSNPVQSRESSGPQGPQPNASRLTAEMKLHLQRASEKSGFRRLAASDLPVRDNDKVQLHVELNRPGYIYLYWYDANGKPTRLWPKDLTQHTKLTELWEPPLSFPGELQTWHVVGGDFGPELIVAAVAETKLTAQYAADFESSCIRYAKRDADGELVDLGPSQERGPVATAQTVKTPVPSRQKRFILPDQFESRLVFLSQDRDQHGPIGVIAAPMVHAEFSGSLFETTLRAVFSSYDGIVFPHR